MKRRTWIAFSVLIAAVWAVSLGTGYRASRFAGSPHYLLTRTSVPVLRDVPPEDEVDAALDEMFEEAGEDTRMTVDEPMFVLGLLDAALPVTAVGFAVLAGSHIVICRRTAKRGDRGNHPPSAI